MFTLLQAHIQVDVVGRVNYYRKLALDDCRGRRFSSTIQLGKPP